MDFQTLQISTQIAKGLESLAKAQADANDLSAANQRNDIAYLAMQGELAKAGASAYSTPEAAAALADFSYTVADAMIAKASADDAAKLPPVEPSK